MNKRRIEIITWIEGGDPCPDTNTLDFKLCSETKDIPESAVIVDRELLGYMLDQFSNVADCFSCPLDGYCARYTSPEDCRKIYSEQLKRRAGR